MVIVRLQSQGSNDDRFKTSTKDRNIDECRHKCLFHDVLAIADSHCDPQNDIFNKGSILASLGAEGYHRQIRLVAPMYSFLTASTPSQKLAFCSSSYRTSSAICENGHFINGPTVSVHTSCRRAHAKRKGSSRGEPSK